jgi:hypothetical protein
MNLHDSIADMSFDSMLGVGRCLRLGFRREANSAER